MLAVNTSDLDMILVGNFLELIHFSAKLGQFDMN